MTDTVDQIENVRMTLQVALQEARNSAGQALVDLGADNIGNILAREVGAFFGDTIWVIVQRQSPDAFSEGATPDDMADFLFEQGVARAGQVYTMLDKHEGIVAIEEQGDEVH